MSFFIGGPCLICHQNGTIQNHNLTKILYHDWGVMFQIWCRILEKVILVYQIKSFEIVKNSSLPIQYYTKFRISDFIVNR